MTRRAIPWIIDAVARHVSAEWIPALFIAAAISVAHYHLEWLSAIEAYVFTALAPSAVFDLPPVSIPGFRAHSGKNPEALVVLLDSKEIEGRYQDRSPLNRCALRDDLEAVYSLMDTRNRMAEAILAGKVAGPNPTRLDTLVIDLDLSPPLWMMQARDESIARAAYPAPSPEEMECQAKIQESLLKHAGTALDPKVSPYPIRTVLMNPIPFADKGLVEKQDAWKRQMPGISFGDPRLTIEYGILLSQSCDPESLAAVAYHLINQSQNNCIGSALAERATLDRKMESDPDDIGDIRARERIDPRKYRTGLTPLPMSELRIRLNPCARAGISTTHGSGSTVDRANCEEGAPDIPSRPFDAVFFGAGAGKTDQVLTPLGEYYGVEAHAVGLLTLLKPLSHGSAFVKLAIDVAYSLLFGMIVKASWRLYLKAKSRGEPFAFGYVVLLVALVALFTFLASLASVVLLGYTGIWASPLLIAIAMVFDGFVRGPVVEAVHASAAPSAHAGKRVALHGHGLKHFLFGQAMESFSLHRYAPASWFVLRSILFIGTLALALTSPH